MQAFLRALHNKNIYFATDINKSRLELAMSIGATCTYTIRRDESVSSIVEGITNKIGCLPLHAIDTTGLGQPIELCIKVNTCKNEAKLRLHMPEQN